MTASVERTDFVSIPVEDIERAKTFYRDILQMHSPDWDAAWPEIESGNVSIYLVDPKVMGSQFSPNAEGNALMLHRRYAP